MRPLMLCRERLIRILRILARHPEGVSFRELARTFGVLPWQDEAGRRAWLAHHSGT